MQELIAAYESKIASMQETIAIQNQTIDDLHYFLSDLAKNLGSKVQDSIKKQAALSIQIEELKSKVNNQTVEISDQDASDLNITPDTEEDDFVVTDDTEEDDFVVADDTEEDDFVVADDTEEDDFVVADDTEEDDFVVAD